ncbi:hypothetical protein OC846_005835 [Tilletia horrida]|uniref:Uncharacterized protein n=1 Tax=Tilletia horrida TaxID=155126 RepID=A0AAN6GK20_9BASI|nr:hypothetical protein OC846_005835 [Tilletia horrida]KAK0560691.1 hypothetical protein OC861_006178 [Tilletia horrida]
MSQQEEQEMAADHVEQVVAPTAEPSGLAQAADASHIHQDLAMLLQSGAVEDRTHESPSDGQMAPDDAEAMAGDRGNTDSTESNAQSLAHFREMVAAARANAEASRAKLQPEVDGSSIEIRSEQEAADVSSKADVEQALVTASTSAEPSSNAAAPKASVQEDEKGDGSFSDAASSSDSDSSESDSDSDSLSDSDSDTATETGKTSSSQRQRSQHKAADSTRFDALPVWANADYEDSDDYDEDGEEGARNGSGSTGRAGPTTKNEVILTADQLNRPTLTVLPFSEPIHYLGKVSSIISGSVVVVEQDVRSQKNGFNQASALGKGRRANGNAPPVAGEEEDQDVLDTGSLLVYSNRKVLGTIFETFGSVLQPMYTVRFASAADVPSLDLDDLPKESAEDTALKGSEEEDDDGDIDGEPVALAEVQVHNPANVGPFSLTTVEAIMESEPTASEQAPTSESGSTVVVTSEAGHGDGSKHPQTSEETQGLAETPKSTPLTVGTPIYYASSRAAYVFTPSLRRDKGSDASNLHDEEVAEEEMEYSDDEAEAEARRRMKKGKGKGKKEKQGPQAQDMEGVEMNGGNGASTSLRGKGRTRGGALGGGPNMRGRGQGMRERGRGRGSGRFSGGGPSYPIRHRDDMSDSTMAQSGHTAATFSFNMNGGMGLPASLPARPQFDYNFDNTGATASAPGSSGRRSNPAPYDERAGGVQHTLSLPSHPSSAKSGDGQGQAQNSNVALQHFQAYPQQQQAYAQQQQQQQKQQQQQLYQQQYYQQQQHHQQQVMHINPLFAQQWTQYQQGQAQPYNYMAAQQGFGHGYPYAQYQQQYAQGYQSSPQDGGGPAAHGGAAPGGGPSSNSYYSSQQQPQ